jgi:outer membrane receptor protein involved in Fe transport
MAKIGWFRGAGVGAIGAFTIIAPANALAQTTRAADPGTQVGEIIVTAQKREQTLNTVPMTVTAATGEVLRDRGITAVSDLPRLVPGFTIQQGAFASTSFTLRGIGFFNSDLGTPPAVTVYVDEAPLPYPAMTKLAAFDLDRVEVMKGPQGTLFGENATGGAVNYIAAKPTRTYEAGADLTAGNFNRVQLGGFVSGPLTDTLSGRLALQWRRGDPWQNSITRPGDSLGRIREYQLRGTLEWSPTDQFTSRLTGTYTHDASDSLAAQFIAPALVYPALAAPGFAQFPVVTKPRAADWTPVRLDTNTPFPYANNNTLFDISWRNDYKLSGDVLLTSLTSMSYFHLGYGQDTDGTPYHINEVIDDNGNVHHFFQEIRVSGKNESFNWIVGANYTHDLVKDGQLDFFLDKDGCQLFRGIDPLAFCDSGLLTGHMVANTAGVFAHGEYNITDTLTAEAGIRFNADRRTFDNCAITTTDHFARFFNVFQSFANGGQPIDPLVPGRCYVLDPKNNFRPVDNIHKELNENSVPWRVGLNWKPQPGVLVYANVSKGYKAGAVPVVGAATVNQFAPVPQESVLSYEIGEKASLLDHRLQLNAAAFYYNYKDKQLRGSLLDPAFGPLEALVSIPKSHVTGAEIQVTATPITGLVIDTSATYVNTRIDEFTGFDAFANFKNEEGTPFPFSPKWQSVTNIDYKWPITSDLNAFAGGSITYNSKTYAGIGAIDLLRIDAFTLLDLRGGIESADGRYRLWVWGKNIANKYYWSNVFAYGNAVSRFVGEPTTWGMSASYRFH